ncbi:MAG TPA: fumarylacetoacetate hydrolase family protein [Chloroflexota bacterium]|jgi:2-keto-4-pentenoate hydratase/2-oxohepta-3-ene-1,7-dioic acid hydratase in catechol pathway
MKLLLFNDWALGVLKSDGRVVDVSKAVPIAAAVPKNPLGAEMVMETVIEGFDSFRGKFEAIVNQEQGVPFAEVTLRPPLPRPPNALCAFSNYQDREQNEPPPPVRTLDFFHKCATSIVGSGATVELPDIPEAKVFQPEPEFAYVIGRKARKVSQAQALDYVFGYMNFSDISARDIPNRRTTFLHKSQETWAPMGPVIVTKDEIPDPQNVRVRLWLNGEQKQDYNTGAMTQPIAAQIQWLSEQITLQPGDLVSCGTHHVGLSPINDGDRVEVEGDGLERLKFSIKSYGPRKDEFWGPPGVRRA